MLVMLAAGCAVSGDLAGRLYDVERGTVLEATFERFDVGHGGVSAIAPDGEHFAAEYSLGEEAAPPGGVSPVLEGQAGEDGDRPPAEDAVTIIRSWPELYGYGANGDAEPVGTATLVGDRATVIEMVLFHISRRGGFGDGVARDNRGRVYRVHLGDLEGQSSPHGPKEGG